MGIGTSVMSGQWIWSKSYNEKSMNADRFAHEITAILTSHTSARGG
jgi:hypothetical protein